MAPQAPRTCPSLRPSRRVFASTEGHKRPVSRVCLVPPHNPTHIPFGYLAVSVAIVRTYIATHRYAPFTLNERPVHPVYLTGRVSDNRCRNESQTSLSLSGRMETAFVWLVATIKEGGVCDYLRFAWVVWVLLDQLRRRGPPSSDPPKHTHALILNLNALPSNQ